jgi:hypothetical protein
VLTGYLLYLLKYNTYSMFWQNMLYYTTGEEHA